MKAVKSAALMCTALIIFSGCGRGNTSVPEFVYPTESIQTTTPSETQTEETPAESAAVTLLSSRDPLHYTELSFDGFSITARGRYSGERLLEISCGTEAEPDYDGEEYTAKLHKESPRGFTTLYLHFEGHSERYRIAVSDSGYIPADVSEVVEGNSAAVEMIVQIPEEGVAEYIDAGKDEEVIEETLAKVKEISDTVCAGLSDEYDKLRALSDWVSENIYYDYDAAHTSVTSQTLCLSHVLETHRTVCGGFSTLFSALCQAQGIECYNIRGTASNNGHCYAEEKAAAALHEWNYAVIGGRGIWVDTVWDTNNAYFSGEYADGERCFRYFDVTDEVLALDHRANICEQRDYFSQLSRS